VNTNVVTRAE